jgi:hypothetical protein
MEIEQPPLQPNPVLIQARRRLMRLSNESSRHSELSALIRDYEALLLRSFNGEDTDDALDDLESQLESFRNDP